MLISDIFTYQFLSYAYISGIIIAILIPLIGSFIVIRKQVFIADTISHVSLAGVSFGYYLLSITAISFNPTIFSVVFAIIGSLAIEHMRNKYSGNKEISMLIVMSFSVAVAILLSSIGNSSINLSSFLFGSINTISSSELYALIICLVVTLLFVFKYYYQILALCIDDEYSKLRYKNYYLIKNAFVILVAIIIALSIKIIGALLIGALIVMPASITIDFAKSFKSSQIFGILFALVSVMSGLVVSYYFSVPSGASIVIIQAIFVMLIKAVRRVR